MKKITIFDVEVAPNHSMVGFMDYKTGKVKQFEHDEIQKIKKYLRGRTLVGFNSIKYDNIILTAMLRGKTAKEIYEISVDIVENEVAPWEFPNMFDRGHIDLIEVAPGQAGLKLYGARMGTQKLQDLPYDPHEKHTDKMWKKVKKYNKIDLQVTKELYDTLLPDLHLRENMSAQYNVDLMSKSGAQIAQVVLLKMLNKTKRDVDIPKVRSVHYKAPDYIKFETEELQKILEYFENTKFDVCPKSGQPLKPKDIPTPIINGVEYELGLGGVHAKNKSERHEDVIEADVASLYPSLMIQNGFYPEHLGDEFLDLFKNIYDTRLKAKEIVNASKRK